MEFCLALRCLVLCELNWAYRGFNHDDRWGHRAGEPNKAVICSIALARLRTDVKGNDLTNNAVLGMAQKLLLFWRKPARRCWWEGIELDDVEGVEGKLKVWIRRVWTLEMVSARSGHFTLQMEMLLHADCVIECDRSTLIGSGQGQLGVLFCKVLIQDFLKVVDTLIFFAMTALSLSSRKEAFPDI